MAPDFMREAEALFSYSQSIRRDLHMHPELGFQEVRTAGIVAKELQQLGMEVTTGVGKTGVVGLLEGEKPGPVILLRFDMDALPIQEENAVDYVSQNPGVMHACGHDSHVAVGLTVARLLNQHRAELNGTVKFMFQPAEEGLGGAVAMIKDGVLQNPAPSKALSFHVWNDRPLGWMAAVPGPVMAGSGSFIVKITGVGGHGASPHITIDPVLTAAQVVTALQSIVSRNISPLTPAVLSVTQIHAGDAFNVIPQTAEIRGTLRFFDPDTEEEIHKHFRQLVEGICAGFGCQAEITLRRGTPAVVNDPQVTASVQAAVRRSIPGAELVTADYQTMGSEDMAYVLDQVPGCYLFLGSANREKGLDFGHHHPRFDIDEGVMPKAAGLIASAALALLSE